MAYTCVYSRALWGVDAPLVRVEVHLAGGLPLFNLVGLPEVEVRESRDRVRSALNHCGFGFPVSRVTVHLAPAELPKHSSRYDLPIAIGILAASRHLPSEFLEEWEFAGELGLSGHLRAIQGALPMAAAVRRAGRRLMIAQASANEACHGYAEGVYGALHLRQVWAHLIGEKVMMPHAKPVTQMATTDDVWDLSDVLGQGQAKRALEVAASGRHHLLMVGPPGVGKSLLARCLPGICPPMEEHEALQLAAIRAAHGESVDPRYWCLRPFRQPHHSITIAAMMGGGHGTHLYPGEVSLSHCGTLHLDEVGEFPVHLLDMLREPMETGQIAVSRSAYKVVYPAGFQLVGTMNPCPCGYRGHPSLGCRCSPAQLERYLRRLSGPLLDRIDLQVELPSLAGQDWLVQGQSEDSATVRRRVGVAWQRQLQRQGVSNDKLGRQLLQHYAPLTSGASMLIQRATERFELSLRAVHRIWRVARTIADLAGEDVIGESVLAEALCYRTGFLN